MVKYCLALIISMILQISNAQDTTGQLNSKLVPVNATTPAIGTPTISIVPGCSSCFSSTVSQISSPTSSSSSTISPDSITTHENQVIIIASSVSAGGLLVIVSFLICCLYRRKQKRAKLNYRTRSVKQTHTVIDEKEVFSSLNSETVKKYNVSKQGMFSDNDDEKQRKNSLPTPPVILYSDVMKKNEEETKQRETDGRDLVSRTSAVSNGTRLSKYNFLAQAFSQMRASYSAGATQRVHDFEVDNTHPQDIQNPSNTPKPEPSRIKDSAHRTFHDSMVLTQYDFDDRKQQRPLSIPESIQTFTKSSTPDIRESTMTMATLHAPLFKNNGFQHPMPSSSPYPYQTTSVTPSSHLYRDSVVSDVSQYSTWPVRRSTTPDDDLQEETGTLHKPIKL